MHCFLWLVSNHSYLCPGIIVNHIIGTTLRRRLCYLFGLAVLIFCPWMRKPCFFVFCCVNWHILWVNMWALRVAKHILYWCFMLCCRNFEILLLCNFSSVLSVCAIFFAFFGLWSIRQKKETLPKAKRPESWVQLKKVTWLSHITSSNTNLDQILESLLSTISTKHQHLAKT